MKHKGMKQKKKGMMVFRLYSRAPKALKWDREADFGNRVAAEAAAVAVRATGRHAMVRKVSQNARDPKASFTDRLGDALEERERMQNRSQRARGNI